MLTLLLTIILSEPSGRFVDGGIRAEDSVKGNSDGKTFTELTRLSFAAKGDHRQFAAQRIFDAFQRYSGPVNVQYPKCHVGRTFEQLSQWDYRRPVPQALTNIERRDFKRACYAMLDSQEPWIRQQAMQHLVIVADYTDLKPMLGLLHRPDFRGLVCIGLARVGRDEVVPALAKELNGPAHEQAAAALEFIGSEKAMEALRGFNKRVAMR